MVAQRHSELLVTGRLNRGQLRYLLPLLRLLWSVNPFVTVLLAMLTGGLGLFAVAQVHLLRQLVSTAQAVVEGNAPLLAGLFWGGAFAGLGLLQATLDALQRTVKDRHQEVLRGVIEERCFRQVQVMPLEQFERSAHYDRLHRARYGMERRFINTTSFLWNMLELCVVLASLLLYLGQFHWGLPLILALGATPGVLANERRVRERNYLFRRHTHDERRFAVFGNLLTGRGAAAEIRLFGFGAWLIGQVDRLWHRLRGERMALTTREARASVISEGLNAITYVVALALSIWLLATGRADLGALAALFVAIESFQHSYSTLVHTASVVFWDLRYIQDFFEFLAGPRLDPEAGRRTSGPLREGIVFENVSFIYPGSEQPAVANVNLAIRPGERLALVGENGAGKTTLVKLLMGLYRPTAGRIVVDGVDLRDVAAAEWHRRFGAVFQDFLRYQTTVRDNITLGWNGGGEGETALSAAVARSGADEVAATLPDGLGTLLGKEFHEGTELSVGQWQRLAIARAYFRPADILILDEPTSALDAKSEAAVYEHFTAMAAERTVVLISHRLGSCRIADRILVLHEGRLLEAGSHAELMAAGGTYADFYETQAAWYR
ncbi:MAG: ABC transporter ATP-binding protein [Chloroflexota bacterium]|nr:ABC transporter ATP-binding protein [Chloroflexota bacterium]